ncbi:MAG: CBS domain-containing protein [Flavobacteriaceae bacterium]|nr:CBS domain-containing protein [Flavobacteriaceae bacterium]
MNLKGYMSTDLLTFSLEDKTIEAIDKMSGYMYSHIIVLDSGKIWSILSKKDLITLKHKYATLKDFPDYKRQFFYVKEDEKWGILCRQFTYIETNILPVADDNGVYLGYYKLSDVMEVMFDTPYFKDEGVVLLVSKNKDKYSMMEISQIVELTGSSLLGIFVFNKTEDNIVISVKIQTNNLAEITEGLRRYKYDVIENDGEDIYIREIKDKADFMRKYMSFND